MQYDEFIKSKSLKSKQYGFEVEQINSMLFDFQKNIVRWSIRKGKSAIFAMTGLGKTPMQLEWANQIHQRENEPILILAPLAVSYQTQREGEKFGIKVNICKSQSDVINGINITNYEKLNHFDITEFVAVVLDESSILKNYSGKMRNEIIQLFKNTKYKLACTATPSPNDFMEIGNHAEFLDVMTRKEMLSMFFVHDGGNTSKWRLKGHAENDFWKWLCSWAIMLRMPSDLGYEDDGFILPELNIIEHIIESDKKLHNDLFRLEAKTLNERREAKRLTVEDKIIKATAIIGDSKESWLIWCYLNKESELLKTIPDAVEIKGSDSSEYKEQTMIDFTNGDIKRLITKPKIAGFGMNWQHCHNVIFIGLDDSFEYYFQAIRRNWRFGQQSPVNVHIILSDLEGSVKTNIERKEKDFNNMIDNMISHTTIFSKEELKNKETIQIKSDFKQESSENWKLYLGDCIPIMTNFENESIHYTITSPPFAELYTYSDDIQDLGNSRNYEQFFEHFQYVAEQLFRVTMSGRIVSLHCVDIPMMKEKHGIIGLYDFPGDLIDVMKSVGFIYHSRQTIWKDPLVEVTRTKALGLMHKQIEKDSTMCRSGLPDYLISFRKPGENKYPVANGFIDKYFIGENPPRAKGIKRSHYIWQRYASPVWMDIRQGNTLQKESVRTNKDEKHICPLQLDVIERGIILYSNENETILDPFMGIGSVGYIALKNNRKIIGCELKESYFNQSIKNIINGENAKQQTELKLAI